MWLDAINMNANVASEGLNLIQDWHLDKILAAKSWAEFAFQWLPALTTKTICNLEMLCRSDRIWRAKKEQSLWLK